MAGGITVTNSITNIVSKDTLLGHPLSFDAVLSRWVP